MIEGSWHGNVYWHQAPSSTRLPDHGNSLKRATKREAYRCMNKPKPASLVCFGFDGLPLPSTDSIQGSETPRHSKASATGPHPRLRCPVIVAGLRRLSVLFPNVPAARR